MSEDVTHARAHPPTAAPTPVLQLPDLPAIDWGSIASRAPVPLDDPEPAPEAPLPESDFVIVTWTTAEWAALHHVLVDGERPMSQQEAEGDTWHEGWHYYRRGYAAIENQLPEHAPSREHSAWGAWRRVRYPGSDAVAILFKSDMHLSSDGKTMPLRQMVAQIAEEVRPDLLVTAGTAGGTRVEDCIGSVMLTGRARTRLSGLFADEPFNHQTFASERPPPPDAADRVEPLLLETPCTMEGLEELASHVEGYDLEQLINAAVEPGKIEPHKRVTERPVLTDNGYDAATTDGNMAEFAAVEMDDAVVGMICNDYDTPFTVVRNISDPVVNAGLPAPTITRWSYLLYSNYGLYTSFNGALCSWALANP